MKAMFLFEFPKPYGSLNRVRRSRASFFEIGADGSAKWGVGSAESAKRIRGAFRRRLALARRARYR